MKPFPASLACLLTLFSACKQPQAKVAYKHYHLTGRVVAINQQDKTAAVDAAAIPNYMEAMTMDYPIASASDLAALKAGEHITAIVNVGDDGSFNLSGIHESGTGK